VTLDTVVSAFCDGATAEEIVQQYPSLNLADVYHVIGYYLRRTSEVEAYLQARRADAEALRTENEARFDPQGVRARLLARRSGGTP
jgi:tRNA C32,U32 (ribose-2'-O)-methylase TrmJ